MKMNFKNSLHAALLTAMFLAGTALFAPHVTAAPGDPDVYADAYNAGYKALGNHDYLKARANWEIALAQAQGARRKASAMLGLAQTAFEQGQLDEALQLAVAVLKMPEELPERARAHLQVADVYRKQGRTKEADAEIQNLLPQGTGPDGKITQADLPQIMYGSLIGDVHGKTPEQIRAALETVAQNPKTPALTRSTALLRVGEIALSLQQSAVARDFFTRSIAAAPTEPQFKQFKASIENKLGDAYAAEGNWSAARQAYERALPDIFEMVKPNLQRKRDAAAKAERQNN